MVFTHLDYPEDRPNVSCEETLQKDSKANADCLLVLYQNETQNASAQVHLQTWSHTLDVVLDWQGKVDLKEMARVY